MKKALRMLLIPAVFLYVFHCKALAYDFNSMKAYEIRTQKEEEWAAKWTQKYIQEDMTDFEKAKTIYDWIQLNVSYEDEEDRPADSKYSRHAVGSAMFEGKGVCSATAALYKELGQRAGLDVIYLYYSSNTTDYTHIWNAVKIDGIYYEVESTPLLGYKSRVNAIGEKNNHINFYYYFLGPYKQNKPQDATYIVEGGKEISSQPYIHKESMVNRASGNNTVLSAKTTEKLVGENRYQTNKRVNEKIRDSFPTSDTVIIASGENFADAIISSNLSKAYDAPIILIGNKVDGDISEQLEMFGTRKIIIVGGTASIPEDVENELKNSYDVLRISGSDRYETSEIVYRQTKDYFEGEYIIQANGENFQPALISVNYLNLFDSPIVIKRSSDESFIKLVERSTGSLATNTDTGDVDVNYQIRTDDFKQMSDRALANYEYFGVDTVSANINSYPDSLSAVSLAVLGDMRVALTDDLKNNSPVFSERYNKLYVVGGNLAGN